MARRSDEGAARRITESAIPKHAQLRRILLELVTERLQPGAAIPSERQLITEYGVSRITVREALGQLVNEGYLTRVRGKGTFVAHRPVQSTLHLASFTEEMRALGHTPTTVVLVREERVAPADTAAALHLESDDVAVHLKRLRLADGVPVSIDDAWFSRAAYPGLLEHDLSGSVYSLVADRYGLPIVRAVQTVAADPASDDVATLLGTRTGAPVLVFDRVSFAEPGPVEHTRSWYRSDRYRVQMEVSAEAPRTIALI
ncbi:MULTISPECIES: GntR family transcriptional regulator [unclassified Curtobacterium]|uniref:GntR family transcriptional regulator n=1 Tax=unclassified Curtobacterium TaxID=257496 RepID=UPI0021AC5C90|nr:MULTISPECIES: GntR family transcriptional regulator [unclassified Curtobacterium]WIB64005.1 GntR family transcriptional regulator [Curtobacterium sp. MCBD17_040]WIE55051.1 GntR family transcriptional regulator [Curtobacterium sp. MCBD17_003]